MIVVIDYGIGNTGSVINALNKIGISNQISSDPTVIKKSKILILPGVGAAGKGMENLKKKKLDKIIIDEIKRGKPFLGICLGMQLLFDESEEGNVKCLGIFKGKVKKFKEMKKIPQIGWNNVDLDKTAKIFKEISNKSYFYFVNSYYCAPENKSFVVGTSEYGEKFASAVEKDNVVGVQFHPEKSGKTGFNFINNFIQNYDN